MTTQFTSFVVLTVIGFVLGGLCGLYIDQSWFPDSFFGVFIAWGIEGGVLCVLGHDSDL